MNGERAIGISHTERFAPSPTGRLHLGHAFSAICAHDRARAAGGQFLLRMEDLDTGRVRPEYVEGIVEDLKWLGLTWDGPMLFQSNRAEAYAAALARLSNAGLTYVCTCTRRDITEAVSAPQNGDRNTDGSDSPAPDNGPIYPGTCRPTGRNTGQSSTAPHAIRLNLAAAIDHLGGEPALSKIVWTETGTESESKSDASGLDVELLQAHTGDIVLRRRDGATAYHLAVVIDDAFQNVTHVTRGADLVPSVPIQRLLQALLDLPVPQYHHHRLIRDAAGKRLAKRHDALALATLKAEGATPDRVRALLGID